MFPQLVTPLIDFVVNDSSIKKFFEAHEQLVTLGRELPANAFNGLNAHHHAGAVSVAEQASMRFAEGMTNSGRHHPK